MDSKKFYEKYSFKNIDAEGTGLIILSQEQLNGLHMILLEIMDDIFSVCDDNYLTCMLGAGTALGAVRHHGFIPWDDDSDLIMMRNSYNEFIPKFKERYGDKYWIHTPQNNPQFGVTLCRIRKKGTKVVSRVDLYDDSEAGVYVDIFIIENIPNNTILRHLHGWACMAAKICMSCRVSYRDRKVIKKAIGDDSKLQKMSRTRLIIGFLCSFMSVKKWTKLTDFFNSFCKNSESKYVSIPAGRWHYFGDIYERKWFSTIVKVDFEGREYPICGNIDEYLEVDFGKDYMTIPPEEKRERHAFWKFDIGTKDPENVSEGIRE